MTIRNAEKHAAATVDWSALIPSLKPGTHCIDIDGVHDCNGRVLILEAKPAAYNWGKGSVGQWSCLHSLASIGATVWVVYLARQGDVQSIVGMSAISKTEYMNAFVARGPTQVDFESFMMQLEQWTFEALARRDYAR